MNDDGVLYSEDLKSKLVFENIGAKVFFSIHELVIWEGIERRYSRRGTMFSATKENFKEYIHKNKYK